MNAKQYIDISPVVEEALKNGKPVVALESTIISHGMPYPKNIESSKKCEEIIRSEGAVPATVAIIGGRIKVGLSDEDLNLLATENNIRKVSRRDFATCISDGANGATTVATTMMIANMAGISVFATGGIGGVHRGVSDSWDISADLTELANTNVCVVCSGVKSILDIGKTLEYLETMGVPVFSMESDEFPAFFTRRSGFKSDRGIKSEAEIAKIMRIKEDLDLRGGILIGNPIPEEFSMDEDKISAAIDEALVKADSEGVKGKEITPFLLDYIVKATGGESLESNMELVWNNCRVAARIAVELKK